MNAYGKLTAVAAIWGASWIAGRVVAEAQVPPLLAAVWRFAFGCLGLLAVVTALRQWQRPPARAWVPLFLMGFTGIFLYNVFFFTGLRYVPAGRASLIVASQPSFIFLLQSAIERRRPSPLRIAGLLLSLAGAVVVLTQGRWSALRGEGFQPGDLIIFGCVLSWTVYTVVSQWAMKWMAPIPTTAYSTLLGAAMLLAVGLVTPPAGPNPGSWLVWGALVFLGLFATTVGFLWYLDGVRELGAPRAGIFINLVPVFAVLCSFVFLGERITGATVLGGLLVVAGVRIINRPNT
jgi:drug/metabolite transporter (DMT)-like permease